MALEDYIFARFGVEETYAAAEAIANILKGGNLRGYSPEVQRLFQRYKESRGRDATKEDLLAPTGLKSSNKRPNGPKNIPGDNEGPGEGASEPIDTSQNEGWGPKAKTPREKATLAARGKRVGKKITGALEDAWKERRVQDESDSIERAKRFQKAEEAFEESGGEAGFYRAKSKLKGSLPINEYEGKFKLTQGDMDEAMNLIFNSSLMTGQKIHAGTGLLALVGEGDGRPPTPGDLRLLNKVFGGEFRDDMIRLQDEGFILNPFQNGIEFSRTWFNFPKGLLASMDLSAPFRQGITLIHRKEWRASFAPMMQAFAREDNYKALREKLQNHPKFEIADNAGVQFGDINARREEAIISKGPEKIPLGIGKIIRMSNRAYMEYLNHLRMDTFASMDDAMQKFIKARLGRAMYNFELENSREHLANYINTATGRGNLGRFEKYGDDANIVLFSPRLLARTLKFTNPYTYFSPITPFTERLRTMGGKGTPRTEAHVATEKFIRRQYLKSLAAVSALAGAAIGLAYLMGARSNFDSRSPDFLKIRIGRTRIDVLGGLQQNLVEASQILHWSKTSSLSGKTTEFGSKYGTDTVMDDMYKFIESKGNPATLSLAADFFRQKDSTGEAFSWTNAAIDRMVPMLIADLKDLSKEGPEYLLLIIPALFGVGIQVQGFENKRNQGLVKPVNPIRPTQLKPVDAIGR